MSDLDQLTAEARYHRQRYDLYRAKVYGPRETSPARLRELAHACEAAEARLAAARQAEPTPAPSADAEAGRT